MDTTLQLRMILTTIMLSMVTFSGETEGFGWDFIGVNKNGGHKYSGSKHGGNQYVGSHYGSNPTLWNWCSACYSKYNQLLTAIRTCTNVNNYGCRIPDESTESNQWESFWVGQYDDKDITDVFNFRCIDIVQRCDGVTDCPLGDDETNCDVNECETDDVPCNLHGDCVDTTPGYDCECYPGWQGDRCDFDVDECATGNICNSGVCSNTVGSFTCSCDSGWEGDLCQIDVDECRLGVCMNGATCINLPGYYSCNCPSGYTGKNCDQELGPEQCTREDACTHAEYTSTTGERYKLKKGFGCETYCQCAINRPDPQTGEPLYYWQEQDCDDNELFDEVLVECRPANEVICNGDSSTTAM